MSAPTATFPVAFTPPGTSRLICVASAKYSRYSEADIIELADGRLLLAVSRKAGGSDFARGEIIGMFSLDAGLTWSDESHVICAPFGDVIDVMSASFCRSPRGLHLFFLGRGPKAQQDTRIYQMISKDDGQTWSDPVRISQRDAYHVVNNARVIRTRGGRMIIPAAFVRGDISKRFNEQQILCLYSDDDGWTWRESQVISLPNEPLMEPGVTECADGSIFMNIRTTLGQVYASRSIDGGQTWSAPVPTGLPAPAAPSTVLRNPASAELWILWCDRPKAGWRGRSRIVSARSNDHGKTWGSSRVIEDDSRHSYGYISAEVVRQQVLLTYYDWTDNGQPPFEQTNLRQRTIPVAWFHGGITPPVFRKSAGAVLRANPTEKSQMVSLNSGLLTEPARWRMWYSKGQLGPKGEQSAVGYAESADQGMTWQKSETGNRTVFPIVGDSANCYHTSIHRDHERIIAFVWRRGEKGESGLWRYTSDGDGRSFARDPEQPLFAFHRASDAIKAAVGEGRISNDAFDVLQNPDGTWEYFAASVEKADDPRAIVPYDNAAGLVRFIVRATSPDGIHWSSTEAILRRDERDTPDTQFYGMQVIHYRGFYLGLLHTFFVKGQTIQPQLAWSHNGVNWARTHVGAISLGDEGSFDSRMILFGSLTISKEELVWLYSGYNWRHNGFRKGEVASAIGRATLPLSELDAWLATLPQP